jgi:hypothetical protein
MHTFALISTMQAIVTTGLVALLFLQPATARVPEVGQHRQAHAASQKGNPSPPSTSPEQARTSSDTQNDSTPSKWWDIAFGGIVAIFTVALTLVAYFQWHVTRETMIETRRSADAATRAAKAATRQALHAEGAVKQAKAALDASIQATRTDQRAWVAVTELTIDEPVAGKSLRIKIHTKNVGKTPARRYGGSSTLLLHPSDNVNIAEFAKSPERLASLPSSPASVAILHPSVEMTLQAVKWDVSDTEFTAIKSGDLHMYAFGEVAYTDVFNIPHSMTFAYKWLGKEKRFDCCPTYNDCD